jgi:nicotinamidase-related amidase
MSEHCIVSRTEAVLVLVDMQERLAAAMAHRESVVAASALLAYVARELAMPVIVTRQYPQGLGDTDAGILAAVGEQAPVDKVAFDCLREPAFCERLEATGRRQVVLAGMEAHICITQTALALRAAGYAVFVVADAVCSRREADCDVALDRLRGAGVVVTTAESVIYEALGEAGTLEFKAVLQLVKAQPLC